MERNKAMTRKQFDKWATKREKLLREIGNLCRHIGAWETLGIFYASDLDKIVDRAKRLRELEREVKP
jgi:hypothetical protein